MPATKACSEVGKGKHGRWLSQRASNMSCPFLFDHDCEAGRLNIFWILSSMDIFPIRRIEFEALSNAD
jgi:hypothetical protein